MEHSSKNDKIYYDVGTVGYAYAVADLLHIGHLRFLQQCHKYCDFLIIGVCTDEEAMSRGKRRPIIPFEERIEMVRALRIADLVVVQRDRDFVKTLKKLTIDGWKIQYIFHGKEPHRTPEGDEDLMRAKIFIESLGGELVQPPYTEGISTSKIIADIVKRTTRYDHRIDTVREG